MKGNGDTFKAEESAYAKEYYAPVTAFRGKCNFGWI